jgi:hypothetical protein
MIEERKKKNILVVNMQDSRSREFLSSLKPEEWLDYHEIISWYDPAHLPRVEHYLLNLHYPSLSDFPSVWVVLPREYTFADEDQVARISGFTTHKEVIDEGNWAMVDAIIESCMMSEEYKFSYVREQFLMNAAISLEAKKVILTCKTMQEMKIMHVLMVEEGVLAKDSVMIETIKEHTGEDLGGVITFNEPKELVSLPAGFKRKDYKTLNG